MIRPLILLAMMAPFTIVASAAAKDLTAPTSSVILTVSGSIGFTNTEDGKAAFDRSLLGTFPQTSFSTATIWTDGVSQYSGVELSTLLNALDAKGAELVMTALNDYAVTVPASEAISGGPILATHVDGSPLSIRDKGPVWLIYPFDDNPDYKTEVTYSRSIWQLKSIEVKD